MDEIVKSWTIEVMERDGERRIRRTNNGFNPFELLGICEETKSDILLQIKSQVGTMEKELHIINDKQRIIVPKED